MQYTKPATTDYGSLVDLTAATNFVDLVPATIAKGGKRNLVSGSGGSSDSSGKGGQVSGGMMDSRSLGTDS